MKVFKSCLEILSANCLSESDVLKIKRNLNPCSYLNQYQSESLLLAVNSAEWNLNEDLTNKGISYLKSKCFKKNGEIRKNKDSLIEEMNEHDFHCIKNFKKFALVGFKNISNNQYNQYVPVYRLISKDGYFFDYTGIQFESSEIVFRGILTGSKAAKKEYSA